MDYNESLQNLNATVKARETYQKSFKDAPNTFDTYDKLLALAAFDFVKAYKDLKSKQLEAKEFDED